MSKLLLIDGSGLLVANYYGTLPFGATEEENFNDIRQLNGYFVNAIYPTIRQILDIAISSSATHLVVAFDKSRNTFRKEISEEYKSNRKETPHPLKQQFILIEKLLEHLNIFTVYNENYEADDLIGSISKQFNFHFDNTYILTKDKDYLQLVDDFTTVWMIMYKKEVALEKLKKYNLTKENGFLEYLPDKVFPYTPALVYKDKGVNAENFNEVLALTGDKADNIKGVRGISEEVAVKLISEYHTINEIYEEIEYHSIKKTGKELKKYWKESLHIKRSPFNALVDYEKDARLSLQLSTIKTDIKLNFTKDDFLFPDTLNSLKKEYETNGFDYFRNNVYARTTSFINNLKEKFNEKIY